MGMGSLWSRLRIDLGLGVSGWSLRGRSCRIRPGGCQGLRRRGRGMSYFWVFSSCINTEVGGVDKWKRGIHMSWDILFRLTFLSWGKGWCGLKHCMVFGYRFGWWEGEECIINSMDWRLKTWMYRIRRYVPISQVRYSIKTSFLVFYMSQLLPRSDVRRKSPQWLGGFCELN